jgi:hypothetical protein
MTVDDEGFWTTATLAVEDRISGADTKRARAHAHSLHRLFDCFGNGAHARAARGHGRHAAEILQALRKAARVPVYIAVKLSKTQSRNPWLIFRLKQKVSRVFLASLESGTNQSLAEHFIEFVSDTRLLINGAVGLSLHKH